MGTRVNYEIFGEHGNQPAVIFFSNSHHAKEDPQLLFGRLVKNLSGVRALVTAVLGATYQTSDRGHRAGDHMFSIDFSPEDREVVVKVVYRDSGGPLLTTCAVEAQSEKAGG